MQPLLESRPAGCYTIIHNSTLTDRIVKARARAQQTTNDSKVPIVICYNGYPRKIHSQI